MADGLNKAMLLGNLGADPELKYTQGNQAVLKLRLATSESFLNKAKERQERTEWHSITVWGPRAEGLNKILTKGSRIFVEGRIQTRQWDDKDGNKRYTTEIVANNILLAGGRGEGGGGGRGGFEGGGGGGGFGGDSPASGGNSDFPGPGDFGDDDIPF